MSERTLERRLARVRASLRADFKRTSSRRWSSRISRWRERWFCFRAEDVRTDSESRRRESWDIMASRYGHIALALINSNSTMFHDKVLPYLFEQVLDGSFGFLLIFCRL